MDKSLTTHFHPRFDMHQPLQSFTQRCDVSEFQSSVENEYKKGTFCAIFFLHSYPLASIDKQQRLPYTLS